MSKSTNKPVIVSVRAQELLQFLDTCRGRPVLYGLYFLLVNLYFARSNYMPVLYLGLARFALFHLGI